MKTLICLILDRSGSMGGKESDVIGGVNTFIKDQQEVDIPADICMVRFDSQAIERFRPLQPLSGVVPLGDAEYQPRGGTPLLDAIGQTMDALEKEWEAGGYTQGILVITTDGHENASQVFTKAMIKERITAAQESGKWAVVYLGSNVDAFHEGGQIGVHMANIGTTSSNSSEGIGATYNYASAAVADMRATGMNSTSFLGADTTTMSDETSLNVSKAFKKQAIDMAKDSVKKKDKPAAKK